jgi:3-oxoadipate enol-lactonase
MTHLRQTVDGPADAPVVVFSNPIGTALELWEPQLPALANRFRVVRYDHRGQGGSEVTPGPYSVELLADDLVSLLDQLGVARASVCGLSLGGAVGMCFAAVYRDRLDSLVLACTSAYFGTSESWQERAALVRRRGIGPLVDPVIQRWFTAEADVDDVARCRAMLEATPVEGYAACCEGLAVWDFRARLHEISAPTLVIGGAQDPATPLAHAEVIASGIGAPLVMIEGAAHLASVEQPGAFNEALLEALTKEAR